MGEFQRRRDESEKPFEAALLVCGRKGKYQLSAEVTDMLRSLPGAPVMVLQTSTHEAMQQIHRFTPKLNIHDTHRVGVAVDHYEPYLDFDELMRRTRSGNSSFNEPGMIDFEDLRRL
jgi:BioD-like phosphotransacetylase family protein